MKLDDIIQGLITELAELSVILKKEITASTTESEKRKRNDAVSLLAQIDLQYMAFGLVLKGIDPSECADFTQLLTASDVHPNKIYGPSKTALEESTLLYRLAIALNEAKAAFRANITSSDDNAARLQEVEEEIGEILTRLEQPVFRNIAHRQPAPSHVDPLQGLDTEFAELGQAIEDVNHGLLSSSQQTVFGDKKRKTSTPRPPEETTADNHELRS